MKVIVSHNSDHGSAGVALLELLIVAPLLLMLSLGSLEIGRFLSTKQSLNMLVREVGDAVFRQCRTVKLDSEIASCISESLRKNEALKAFGPADAEIVITLYEYSNLVDMSGEEPVVSDLINLKGTGSTAGAQINVSRHSADSLYALVNTFKKHPRIVVAEGFSHFHFLSTLTAQLLGGDRQLYDTIYF